MQKLHLVGVTTDDQGLILSARRGARSGGYTIAVDAELAEVVEDLRRRQLEAQEAEADEAADPAPSGRVESGLSVREIQARLRRGRSVAEVADAAGVEPSWVERFAAPVLAEQAQVISQVRSTPLRRARLGVSALSIGPAVAQNLADRGLMLTPGELDTAWRTHQVSDGRWAVEFAYRYRNRDHVLRFDLDERSGDVAAADRASGQLGFVAPDGSAGGERPRQPKTPARPEALPSAKRATVSTGFRASAEPTDPVSTPAKERKRAESAMARAAAKRAAEAERAAARREREKRQKAERDERERLAKERAAAAEAKAKERAAAKAAKEKAAKERAAKAAKAKAAKEKAAKAKAAKAKAAKSAEAKPSQARKATKATKTTKASKASKATKPTTAASTGKARKAGTTSRAVKATSAEKAPAPRTSKAPRASKAAATAAPAAAPRASTSTAPARVESAKRPSPGSQPRTRADERGAEPGLTGAAADVYGPAAARALFRAGLVEQVNPDATGGAASVEAPQGNGSSAVSRSRPADRPRRTRPLRATPK